MMISFMTVFVGCLMNDNPIYSITTRAVVFRAI